MYGIIFLVVAIAVQVQVFSLTAQRFTDLRSGGNRSTNVQFCTKVQLNLNLALNPPFCQTAVICSGIL